MPNRSSSHDTLAVEAPIAVEPASHPSRRSLWSIAGARKVADLFHICMSDDGPAKPACHKTDNEQNQKEEEEDLRNSSRTAAMPPNPKTAAISAMIKNVSAHDNIVTPLAFKLGFCRLPALRTADGWPPKGHAAHWRLMSDTDASTVPIGPLADRDCLV